ncbi:bifunctional folylpolyglutamate synthase/dihydrofolate synthase [Xanthocytophaga flava]|uniref:bifunctional folylpolyglutamate synthase/dihydrofolate synthase n=1 Tax=Xanthocytophaga flava TaxID=3048013 RepID=UPI0028D8E1DE|nr:folylpolyglutamate synthase/dihydrofolate synthase family protein [Xanthocytophaga flavus]MDJ1469450.1 folylpolyglutamate synthase/dihydrofolate synthase family protein [Xanthocytophaga flavus]
MTYQQTIEYLYSRLPVFHRIGKAAYKADLNNTLALCKHLGNPERKFKSIHIAGTNGKGSSSHMLAAILQSAGYKTGLYTSPHLKSFTERIRVNGEEMPEQKVVEFVEANKAFIEDVQPSFFELTVGMAFDYFAQEKVDIAVIEVGLGGRLDSTNVIQPEVSLITNISWDHTDILGDTLEKIAGEKAGIIKENTPVVISEYQQDIEHVFVNKAKQEHAPLYFASQHIDLQDKTFVADKRFVSLEENGLYTLTLQLSLVGDYQLKNVAGVIQTVRILQQKGWKIEDSHIQQGIANTVQLTGLKGRWQVLAEKPLTICDTGHNEGGIRFIVEQLKRLSYEKLHIVMGVVNDKDPEKVLKLLPQDAFYYFCQAHLPRAMDAELLAQKGEMHELKGIVIPDVNDALAEARRRASTNDVIFIGGSTFVVAELKEL